MRASELPFRWQLVIAISVLVFIIAAFLLVFFPARQKSLARRGLEDKAVRIAEMVAYSAAPAVEFDDAESARSLLESVAGDLDFRYALALTPDGQLFASHGDADITEGAIVGAGDGTTVFYTDDLLVVAAPVLSRGGSDLGSIRLGLGLDRIERQVTRSRLLALFVSLGVLGIGVVTAFLIADLATVPLRIVVGVSKAVADGDLAVSVDGGARSKEFSLVLGSMGRMVAALRALVAGINTSADELAALASGTSASTQEISASTQEMARTCQNLANRADEQAEMVQGVAGHASRILSIAGQLAEGTAATAERNAELLSSAEEHHSRLLEGSTKLEFLASEIEQSAEEAQTLARMSTEIQQFVTQANDIATQTDILALNASIEAARAGEGGRGFAVVAEEIRALAIAASESAEVVSRTVENARSTVEETRERLSRLAQESETVQRIAESTAAALQDVAEKAAAGSDWSDEISEASADVRRVVNEINERLGVISKVTESFAISVVQIASSAQEQSASAEEIAATATQLAQASHGLALAVSSFRLPSGQP